jgi:hypothetical protein
MHVARWIAARLGLEPIRQQPVPNNVALTSCDAVNIDSTLWPEGHQLQREVRLSEQTGWAQSNWAWRSVGHVNYPGSIHPKPDKAESCFCLGVLRCQSCGKLVRPQTKTAEIKAQILRNCPGQGCGDGLEWITCHARTLHFAVEEDSVEYSVWMHEGFHSSHPRPPAGRRPACTHHTPIMQGNNSHGVLIMHTPSVQRPDPHQCLSLPMIRSLMEEHLTVPQA